MATGILHNRPFRRSRKLLREVSKRLGDSASGTGGRGGSPKSWSRVRATGESLPPRLRFRLILSSPTPHALSCPALGKHLQGGSLTESRPLCLSLLCLHPLGKQGGTLTLSCPDLQPHTGYWHPADQLGESSNQILPLKCLYVACHPRGSNVVSVSHSHFLSMDKHCPSSILYIRTSRPKSQVSGPETMNPHLAPAVVPRAVTDTASVKPLPGGFSIRSLPGQAPGMKAVCSSS